MKKRLIGLFFAIFCLTISSLAQGKEDYRDKIKARRVAFISDKLALTPEEAQRFWPLYNEYQDKKQAINKEYKNKTNLQLLSDAEVETFLEHQLEKEEKLLTLKKTYLYKMKETLPIRKIAMLSRVENRFKKWMLEQIKTRRGNN